jgi:hypothetical protein
VTMTRLTLTLDLMYNDERTDPDGVARLLDKMLETATDQLADARLDVNQFGFDDYGVLEFDTRGFVPEKPIHVTVTVEGGCCSDATLDEGDCRQFCYSVNDLDDSDCDEDDHKEEW